MALTSEFVILKLYLNLFDVLVDVLFALQTFGTAHPDLCSSACKQSTAVLHVNICHDTTKVITQTVSTLFTQCPAL